MKANQKSQIKQNAKRWLALLMAILLLGGAVLSGVMSMLHFH